MAYTTIDKHTAHFNTITYTGNAASTRAITGVGFQPDILWIKNRDDSSRYHVLADAVRGTNGSGAMKLIYPNDTQAENTTDTANIKTLDSDGFTVGSDNNVNKNSAGQVAWNWKAGGAGSSNSDGSVSATVSANTTAGISIVKLAKPNTNVVTVGHGLSTAPKFIIGKDLDTADNWTCYHHSMGNGYGIYLNGTNAEASASSFWNSTSPTNQVFTLGSDNTWNSPSLVFYCFAEVPGFSKIGEFRGNETSDNAFVYTGFKPSFVLIKNFHGINNWMLFDNKRDGYNPDNDALHSNTADSEQTDDEIDIVSNGFKIRNSNQETGHNGHRYLFIAFGQSLTGSNNVPATAR